MEIFRTDDNSVTKFIHTDGSETAIKSVLSQSTFIDQSTGEVEIQYTNRNKYSIFISASVGCYMACPFCHLTIKNCAYKKLTSANILNNLKEAVTEELKHRPELGKSYVKICWMGMGDAVNRPYSVNVVTLGLLDWIMENGYAVGLDSVDVSTVLPKVDPIWIDMFDNLNTVLAKYPLNPNNASIEQAELSTNKTYTDRSIFRLFYSLHSAVQSTRDRMVPNALPLAEAIPLLHQLEEQGVSVLLHQVFVERLNDNIEEIDALRDLLEKEFPENELRILRYNFCDRSPYREWEDIIPRLGQLLKSHKRLKIQISAGKEVQAACGQFLVSVVRNNNK